MGKEYRYRKHIRWGQYVICAFFALLFLFMVGIGGYLAWTPKATFTVIPFAFFAIVELIAGGVLWYSYYRLAGTVISVDHNAIVYKCRGSEKRFPIENVYLEFAAIRYFGGWLKIKSKKDTIRITVVLEDINGFVQELKAALDNKQLSNHYDSHKLFSFLKTAVYTDQNWERMYAIFGKLFLMIFVISITILNGYVFATIPIWGIIVALFWVFFSTAWIVTAYTIAEIILMRQVAKKSVETTFTFPPRDMSYEKQVFDKTITWGGITYLLVSSLVFVLVVYLKMFGLQ